MPRGDRTGPAGFGPMTGRRAGFCAGYAAPGYMNPMPCGGFGWGRGYWGGGFGRGWRNRAFAWGAPGPWAYPAAPAAPYPYHGAQPDPQDEQELLKQEAEELKRSLSEIEKRLSEIEQEQEG